jgi:hypothetical protein
MGGAVDWIYLSQNVDKLGNFVKAVMNFSF